MHRNPFGLRLPIPRRQAVAERYTRKYATPLEAKNVAITAGAKQAISNALLVLLERGDEVIIPVPYWVSYSEMVKLAGGKSVFVPTSAQNDYKIDAAALKAALTERSRVLLLNSPNNPTGAVYTRAEIESIFRVLEGTNVIVISDEIYEDLILEGEYFSVLQMGAAIFDRAVVISGVSKTFAMTGWRIGWAMGNAEFIAALGKIAGHQTSNACTLSQFASLEAMKLDDSFINMLDDTIRRRRALALELIGKIRGFVPVVPKGAFYVFCDVRPALNERFPTSAALAEAILQEAHVAVVPGEAFGLSGFLRLSIAESEENIAEALHRIANLVAPVSAL